ncbi:MAG: hypothetical protein WBV82_21020 [Myxococcaceae bacterium]
MDSLDDRYQAFNRPLVLASWKKAVGEAPGDVAQAEQAEKDFYRDQVLRSRLVRLAAGSDELARRAREWLRFIDRDRLADDDEVRRINDQIGEIANEPFGPEKAALVMTLLYGKDVGVRQPAIEEVAKRTSRVLPLMQARAKRLDVVAQQIRGIDGLTFIAGPDARPALEQICEKQIRDTQRDWAGLIAHATKKLGRAPGFADYGPEAIAWTTKAGAFYRPEDLPRLAEKGVAQLGFNVREMNIKVRTDVTAPGGAAFDVSIPDDVRFFLNAQPGFEGARGYFHELGHAIHMKLVQAKHLPAKTLPQDRALNEGIGEIFGLIPRLPEFVKAEFPNLSDSDRAEFHASVRAFDAFAVRANCLMARIEAELHSGSDVSQRWPAIYSETFGTKPETGPAFLIFHGSYLRTPLYTYSYVQLNAVRDRFLQSLDRHPLLSPEAGAVLRKQLLEPGNALTLNGYLSGQVAR